MKKLFLGICLLTSSLCGAQEYRLIFNTTDDNDTLSSKFNLFRMAWQRGAPRTSLSRMKKDVRINFSLESSRAQELPNESINTLNFEASSQEAACSMAKRLLEALDVDDGGIRGVSIIAKQEDGNWESLFFEFKKSEANNKSSDSMYASMAAYRILAGQNIDETDDDK